MIYRDRERGGRVTVSTCNNIREGSWSTTDATVDDVGAWEPTFDNDLWRERRLLHLFVQAVGQGDGEGVENVAPQPVRVLEYGF